MSKASRRMRRLPYCFIGNTEPKHFGTKKASATVGAKMLFLFVAEYVLTFGTNHPGEGIVSMATTSKSGTKKGSPKSSQKTSSKLKDPRGGLTAAGRKHFKEKEGANLKPGVTKKESEMTLEEMRRKGSFLRRHYANPRGPLLDDNGQPTRHALQARAWGEPVPKTDAAVKKLADKGTRLLDKAKAAKNIGSKKSTTKSASKNSTKPSGKKGK